MTQDHPPTATCPRWRAAVPMVDVDGVRAAFAAPDPALAEFVTDYAFFDSGPAGSTVRINHYLPGLANVCVTFDAGPLTARIRNHRATWGEGAMLFGPSSQMMTVESHGGCLVGFGVTPLGWARLFGKGAHALANRVVPLARLVESARVAALCARLAAAGTIAEAVALLDATIAELLCSPPRDAALITAIDRALRDPAVVDCAAIEEIVGAPAHVVRRVAQQYFGFGPKLLLRRQRFVRAAMAVVEHGTGADLTATPGDYYDQSHFIRDAQSFLGMTARQFARDITPLMEAMRQGREKAFGSPLQSLITPGRDNLPDRLRPMPTLPPTRLDAAEHPA